MKSITIPESVDLLSLSGDPIYGPDGSPLSLSFYEFLLSRLADPAFTGEQKGMAAGLFVFEAHQELLRQKSKHPGEELEFENATFAAIRRATERPANEYDPRVRHCFVPFFHAVMEAKDA